jgi:hypothetical protein
LQFIALLLSSLKPLQEYRIFLPQLLYFHFVLSLEVYSFPLPLGFSLFGGLQLLLEYHTLLPRVVFLLQPIFFVFSGPKLLPEWLIFFLQLISSSLQSIHLRLVY